MEVAMSYQRPEGDPDYPTGNPIIDWILKNLLGW